MRNKILLGLLAYEIFLSLLQTCTSSCTYTDHRLQVHRCVEGTPKLQAVGYDPTHEWVQNKGQNKVYYRPLNVLKRNLTY